MRITSCVSALLCTTLACAPAPASKATTQDRSTVIGARSEDGRTRLDLQVGQNRRSLLVTKDATVAPDAPPSRVSVVAEISGRALVITDTYASLPGGLSYCQAGEEQFLRVISIANGGAASTFVTKLASCRTNLELADPGVQWDAHTATLGIHWLSGPNGTAEDRTIVIAADGSASAP